ncbi:sugar ABC transporter ATP-binding protein [Peribacillus psychrosaccharolyticus]|uniref:Ribose/galactose/methyl galactoside import ATP-binding protein n=1 Tax=Peribacillus psychrosaccharolyticus TaxID=1407 RepID=A0A974NQM4_PERPY|nr:sugar ABC transporter ATP-binding protein [Peribacillus psychrosaccharolyticus]MEC2057692.1 sugar ABC transporter ATP-binding protein [Peribacillus psychrosaccharolyticus]MED3746382.1 sugar ABC transporter ATP-binding protein [Peribacillus psychrosaccharolyticus]QQT01943.1 sugar ABC transporter ATP-binding protein [Peribacillus psychrosaccharolyticus]
MSENYILEMENVTKEFPGVKALDSIQFKVKKGSVHALMGENGAGKSTLMKIIFGIYTPDTGMIKFKGHDLKVSSTKEALKNGISMIHQELSPVPHMTVAENIFLGREPTKGKFGWVNNKKMIEDAKDLFKTLNIDLDPNSKMKDLSIANMQMVEIATAVSYDADLIIMDEPTSAITEKEVEKLFEIINSLNAKGVSIIYISHKMDEIFRICDEITVFRDGQYIGTKETTELTQDTLIQMMVGREIKQVFHKEKAEIKEVILAVSNLSKEGKFDNISFEVRKGEIVGISGLMGSGRTEVIESIFGIDPPDSGDIFIHGEKVKIKTPQDAIKLKVALLTEDRKLSGAFLPISIKENMIISSIDQFLERGYINKKLVDEACNEQVEQLNIKTPSTDQLIMNLSGGNQQKVLLARWLLNDPDILILDEPTRGVDVGAKSEIHKLMSKLAQKGTAILMISSEMPEVLGMSDRVIVMHEGNKKGELNREEANQEKILEMAYS